MRRAERQKQFLLSPLVKTISFFISTVVAGVLCGIFVAQIMEQNVLVWSKFYRVWSFYALLILAILVYSYNKYTYKREKALRDFIDSEFCAAYLREQCLPEMAQRLRALIRQGKAPTELREYKDFMETFYK